jgi:CDP-diacylglycerol--serine O-phosphatidyltransferase
MERDQKASSGRTRPRGIYLLPNLLTTAALFSGFSAIVAAMQGRFEIAVIAVFIAMIADGLDGRVARLTNTQTAFGAEYDSLSDMVAFAIAPALMMYSWSLSRMGKVGWLVAFIYAAATALRLARFNTQPYEDDKRYFQGLPCPSAAAVVIGMVWLGNSYGVSRTHIAIPVALIVCLVAGLMVSRIRYYSFKQVDVRGKVPFLAAVSMVLVVAAIAVDPAQVLSGLFFIYALSGPFVTLWQMRRMKKKHRSNNAKKGVS